MRSYGEDRIEHPGPEEESINNDATGDENQEDNVNDADEGEEDSNTDANRGEGIGNAADEGDEDDDYSTCYPKMNQKTHDPSSISTHLGLRSSAAPRVAAKVTTCHVC